jgi:hypothetical protein
VEKLNGISFDTAKTLEAAGQYSDAAAAYEALTSDPAQTLRARRRRTECLMRLQRWPEAAAEVAAVFDACDRPLNRDLKRWLNMRVQFGDAARPADPVTPFVTAARAGGDYATGPYILLTAAAPKTGSTSLSVALAATLSATKINLLELPPTHDRWGTPWWPAIDALQGCALVNHSHLSPDPETVRNIAARPWVKVAVHLRNPVETIESTIDMVIRQRSPNLLSGTPHLATASETALRDWVLTTYLPRLAAWIRDWVRLVDAQHPWIAGLSTMDDMRGRGQDAVAQDLAAGLPGILPAPTETEPQRTGNRLRGASAITLTPDEVSRIKAAMSPALMDRFGWA